MAEQGTGAREGIPTHLRRKRATYSSSDALQTPLQPHGAQIALLGAAVSRALVMPRVMRVTDAVCSGVLIAVSGMATVLRAWPAVVESSR